MNPPPPPGAPILKRIKRIGPLQLGKMLAVLYGCMGLLFLPVFLIMSLVASQAPGGPEKFGIMAMGVGMAICMPIFYAVIGFVFGIIGAFIYNVVAKWIGGIEVEVE